MVSVGLKIRGTFLADHDYGVGLRDDIPRDGLAVGVDPLLEAGVLKTAGGRQGQRPVSRGQ